jgi:hypothetical protein
LVGALMVGGACGCGSSTSSPDAAAGAASGGVDAIGGKTGDHTAGGAAALSGTSGGGMSGASGVAGSGPGTSGSSGFDPAVLDVDKLTVSYCTTVRKCCAGLPVDEAPVLGFCDPATEGVLNLIIAGKIVGNRTAIAACDAAYKAAAESCSAVGIRKACRDFVVASQQVGELCLTADDARGQCQVDGGTAACVPMTTPATGNIGVCTAVKHGALGEHCDLNCPSNGCDTWALVSAVTAPVGCFEMDGLTCSYPYDGLQTCSPIPQRGQACVVGTCAGGDLCTTADATGGPLFCQARPSLGEPCTNYCSDGLACIKGTCQPDVLGTDRATCENHIN